MNLPSYQHIINIICPTHDANSNIDLVLQTIFTMRYAHDNDTLHFLLHISDLRLKKKNFLLIFCVINVFQNLKTKFIKSD